MEALWDSSLSDEEKESHTVEKVQVAVSGDDSFTGGPGKLILTTQKVRFERDRGEEGAEGVEAAIGWSVALPHVALHAVMHPSEEDGEEEGAGDGGEERGRRSALYLQVAQTDDSVLDITININGVEDEAKEVETLFEALNAVAALHPSAESDDKDMLGQGEGPEGWFSAGHLPDEEEAEEAEEEEEGG